MNTKTKRAVVVGRFQPFHNGHLEYVLKSLERTEKLYVGITTPGETATEYEPRDESRLGPTNNPFTYEERMEMIRLALLDEQVDLDRVEFVHFEPHNVAAWHAVVPSDAVYFLLLLSEGEKQKVWEMEAQGLRTEVVDVKHEREHVGNSIRDRIINDESWEHLVPKAVATYLRSMDLPLRLREAMKNTVIARKDDSD